MAEEWRDISGTFGKYRVSSLGRVASLKRKEARMLKPYANNKGYLLVKIHYSARFVRAKSIHRLVASQFLTKKPEHTQVNHKNGEKTDNNLENLEWCTSSHNIKHAFKTGLRSTSIKQRESHSPLIAMDVQLIREAYWNKKNQAMSQKRRPFTISNLAIYFNVGFKTVSNIVNNKTWRHIL